MKYKRLAKKELESLEREFIMFLSSQSIEAEEWEKLKKTDKKKAEGLIDIFSDLVWEKILSANNYTEKLDAKEFRTALYGEKQAQMIIAKVLEGSKISFRTKNLIKVMQNGIKKGEVELYRATKSYAKTREMEMMDAIKEGAFVSRGNWYKALQEIVAISGAEDEPDSDEEE